MNLSLQTFATLVQNMAAAVQGAASQLLDLSVGSILRALLEASASVALWLQWLIVLVLNMTRAATSEGPVLDSWMADFSFTRLPAAAATGQVTFSRYAPTQAAFIPVGAVVLTADGTQSFMVLAPNENASANTSAAGYMVAAGVASITVSAIATQVGSAGNIQAGAIGLLASAIPGIDMVSNAAAFSGGIDAEPDAAFRARFVNYINSRSQATKIAVGAAISAIQQNLVYLIQENVNTGGQIQMGNFVVTIDDGSGDPPASLLQTVVAAIEPVRPVCSQFAVQPPAVQMANVSLTITLPASANVTQIGSAVSGAITNFINALPIGATLPWSRIAQIAYSTNGLITNVSDVLVNNATADIVPPVYGVIKAGSVAVG